VSGPTWEDFVEYAKGWVAYEEAHAEEPEFDWQPIAFIQADGERLFKLASEGARLEQVNDAKPDPGSIGLIAMPLDGDPAQPEICEPLKGMLAYLGAQRCALVMTAWMSHDPLARARYGSVSKAPDVYEAVMLLAFDRTRLDIWQANIVRSNLPPMLQGWHHYDDEGASTELTTHLQEALVPGEEVS